MFFRSYSQVLNKKMDQSMILGFDYQTVERGEYMGLPKNILND